MKFLIQHLQSSGGAIHQFQNSEGAVQDPWDVCKPPYFSISDVIFMKTQDRQRWALRQYLCKPPGSFISDLILSKIQQRQRWELRQDCMAALDRAGLTPEF